MYPVLRDTILLIQGNLDELDVEKITALTLVACQVGEAPFINLPAMLRKMQANIREEVLQRL